MEIEVKKARPGQTEEGGGGGRDIIPSSYGQTDDTENHQDTPPKEDSDNDISA